MTTPELKRWQDACAAVKANPTPENDAAECAAYDAYCASTAIDRRAQPDLNPYTAESAAAALLFVAALLLMLWIGGA